MEEQEQAIERHSFSLTMDIDLVESIEDLIHLLKRTLPSDKRRKLNRSKFFEIVSVAVISDYNANYKESYIQELISDWSSSDTA